MMMNIKKEGAKIVPIIDFHSNQDLGCKHETIDAPIEQIKNLFMEAYTNNTGCHLCGIDTAIMNLIIFFESHVSEDINEEYKGKGIRPLATYLLEKQNSIDELLEMIYGIFNITLNEHEISNLNENLSNIQKDIGCAICFKHYVEQGFKELYLRETSWHKNREFYEFGADWETCGVCEKPTCNGHYMFDQYGDICKKCFWTNR